MVWLVFRYPPESFPMPKVNWFKHLHSQMAVFSLNHAKSQIQIREVCSQQPTIKIMETTQPPHRQTQIKDRRIPGNLWWLRLMRWIVRDVGNSNGEGKVVPWVSARMPRLQMFLINYQSFRVSLLFIICSYHYSQYLITILNINLNHYFHVSYLFLTSQSPNQSFPIFWLAASGFVAGSVSARGIRHAWEFNTVLTMFIRGSKSVTTTVLQLAHPSDGIRRQSCPCMAKASDWKGFTWIATALTCLRWLSLSS